MNIHDREYSLLVGSDVQRDGMFLELYDGPEPNGSPLAECFYSDVDGSFALTIYGNQVSDAALAWLRTEAERRLPPTAAPPNER